MLRTIGVDDYRKLFTAFKRDLRVFYLLRFKHSPIRFRFTKKPSALLYTADFLDTVARFPKRISHAKHAYNVVEPKMAKRYPDDPIRVSRAMTSYRQQYAILLHEAGCLFAGAEKLNDLDISPHKAEQVFLDLKRPLESSVPFRDYADEVTFYSWCAKYICQRLRAARWKPVGSVYTDIFGLGFTPHAYGWYPKWDGYTVALPKVKK